MSEEQELSEVRCVMVIVAHPDDAEFAAAGTVAKWVGEGKEVVYVVCTSGDKGTSDPSVSPAQLAEVRRREQEAACRVLGVKEVVFLGYEDGVLENTLELRRDLVRQIRRFRPDAIICQDPLTRWHGQQYLNHPDHRAAGGAALDAVYPSARDPHVFSDLLAEGLQPHKVRHVYISSSEHADVFVDIAETIETKIAALYEHASQVGDRRAELAERVRERSARLAEEHGLRYAEGFKYVQLR